MNQTPPRHIYDWKPSLPDGRDHMRFDAQEMVALKSRTFAETFSLRLDLPKPVNQLSLGGCTANTLSGLLQFFLMENGRADASASSIPSRLFIYYLERLVEGTVSTDSGAFGRDGFAALRKLGCPPESLWPYIIAKFREKPDAAAYADADWGKISHYTHARTSKDEVYALIAERKPVAFGFKVPAEFESPECLKTGIMPLPGADTRWLGGHEIYAMGWKPEYTECRNCWGDGVMDEGNVWIPNDFLFGGFASDWRAIQA